MKKYRLTDEKTIVGCRTLYRIQALRDFGDVKEGEFGGWIESEKNLSHEGSAWVSGNARVSGNALVYGDAWVSGNARVSGDADIKHSSDICSMSGFGSALRTTTAFKTKDGAIHVTCGCFYGNLDDFYNRVEETHGDTLYGREYKKMIELIKIHFGIE
jgi:hypothetical protein|nr:MAG TPA: Putative transferase, nesg, ydcK, Structural Genomics.38A [Caudoviricetes sp.]